MLEVIVRMSIDRDTSSVVRNTIAPILGACGVQNDGTGEWRGRNAHPIAVAGQLSNVIDVLLNPNQINNAGMDVELDHLWIYIKRVN